MNPSNLHAQADSLNILSPDSALVSDSIFVEQDSLITDAAKSGPIDDIITYTATDSTVYDIQNHVVKMYNTAKVVYGDITLEANFIAYDFKNNKVTAYALPDTSGAPQGHPVFADGDQSFLSDTIRYDFKSKVGLISSVRTDDGESYVHAEKSKRHTNEEIHNLWGKYTTCSADNPHYHFRFKKMIIIPEKKIVTGPAFLKVRKIPTPLAVPFGFFPNNNKQKAGILLPSYGDSEILGFFLLGAGYYVPINEYLDTRITGDIYSRGTWGLKNQTRYVNKYRFSGNLDFSYNSALTGNVELKNEERTNTFKVGWTHRQDAKASVNRSFSARLNLGSIQKDRNNFNSSADNYIQNNSNSTISYARNFRKMQISSTITHNQNSQTGIYNFTLPSLNFSVNRFFLPTSFLRKNKAGSKWYEKIAVNYSSTMDNKLNNVTESDLSLNNASLLKEQFLNGVRHSVATTTSLKVGPLSINPSINYRQLWHFKRNEKFFNEETNTFDNDSISGFWMTDNISVGASMTTKVYGMFQFRSEKIQAIRHVITPTLGFSFSPEHDFNLDGFQNDSLEFDEYNPYTLSVYRQNNIRKSGSINFGLANNVEMKIRDRKDTLGTGFKKVGIIDFASVNSSYNLLADSLNLSNLSVSMRTKLFKKLGIVYSSSYDPYRTSATGGRLNEYYWSSGDLPRLINANLGLNFNLRGGENDKKKNAKPGIDPLNRAVIEENRGFLVDFSVPWTLNATYTYGLRNDFDSEEEGFVKTPTQNIRGNGDIRIIETVKLGFNAAYNVDDGKFTSMSLDLNWDLHCWEFSAFYIPVGNRKSYNIRLNVKSSILQDLKLQRRGDIEGQGLFF